MMIGLDYKDQPYHQSCPSRPVSLGAASYPSLLIKNTEDFGGTAASQSVSGCWNSENYILTSGEHQNHLYNLGVHRQMTGVDDCRLQDTTQTYSISKDSFQLASGQRSGQGKTWIRDVWVRREKPKYQPPPLQPYCF